MLGAFLNKLAGDKSQSDEEPHWEGLPCVSSGEGSGCSLKGERKTERGRGRETGRELRIRWKTFVVLASRFFS